MSIKELLNGCWKHYKYSPKDLRELQELTKAMEIKVGKPTKASGARLVLHLLRALPVLLQKKSLQQSFLTLSRQQKLEMLRQKWKGGEGTWQESLQISVSPSFAVGHSRVNIEDLTYFSEAFYLYLTGKS